jgi:dTDP-4-dehydrorhamnose reductase
MKIAVLGSNGLLGSTLVRAASAAGHSVAAFGRAEMDLRDHKSLASWIWTLDAGWVVNCAAVTDVDACESGDGAEASLIVNAVAPEVIGAACRRAGAGFVHISTDYVFYGAVQGCGEGGQYVESDEPSPRNRYGAHKLMGEAGARAHGAFVLRTAWLYGPGGKNFISKSYEAVASGRPLSADAVSISTPTLASNMARYILAVVATDDRRSGDLYHCCDRGECTRWDMLSRVRLAMLPAAADLPPIARGWAHTGTAARPVRTPLDSSSFFRRFGGSAFQMETSRAAEAFVGECRAAGNRIVSGGAVAG